MSSFQLDASTLSCNGKLPLSSYETAAARTVALKNSTPLAEKGTPCSSGDIVISMQTAPSAGSLIKRIPAHRQAEEAKSANKTTEATCKDASKNSPVTRLRETVFLSFLEPGNASMLLS
jgi:hypothetical protein